MNILVTGANGQLGNEMRLLAPQFPEHRFFFSDLFVPDNAPVRIFPLDITCRDALRNFVSDNSIQLVINCAAYTNVDRAEQDEPEARRINALAVENIALTGARVIHISTDYVFSGEGCCPYRESDPVAPRTAYGRTKLEGEQLLFNAAPDALVFRTAWLYSSFGNNFVKTMLRLGAQRDTLSVVYDQVGTPTFAADLAAAVMAAVQVPEWHPGIYHFTNEGVCSWYDFALEVFRQHNALVPADHVSCRVLPCLSSEYASPTPRPHYSVLDKALVKRTFNLTIPHWTDSLTRCLELMK
ncbi:MAG: dTDP-4-dehydrorhamnose reductase [Paludibacteraceae bacterium]|nr:dTDP-4-dehydrorhamnose reductase [Paludibacteraceae bacterium]